MDYFSLNLFCVTGIAIPTLHGNMDLPFYGQILCNFYCQRNVGCTGFSFNPTLLSCSLIQSNISQADADRLNVQRVEVDSANNGLSKLVFPSSTIKFLNRRGQVLYRDPNPLFPSQKRAPNQRLVLRMFTYAKASMTETTVDEIYINNQTLQKFPITFNYLVILAYVPSIKVMLITETKDRLLHTISLNGKKSDPIEHDVSCLAVANDKIFYVKQLTLLYRMSLNFSMNTQIMNLSVSPPVLMAADSNREELFMIGKKYLYKNSYDGRMIRSIVLGIGGANCFDMSRRVLYHEAQNLRQLIAINLKDFRKKTLTTFNKDFIIAICSLEYELALMLPWKKLVLFNHASNTSQSFVIPEPYEKDVVHDTCLVIKYNY